MRSFVMVGILLVVILPHGASAYTCVAEGADSIAVGYVCAGDNDWTVGGGCDTPGGGEVQGTTVYGGVSLLSRSEDSQVVVTGSRECFASDSGPTSWDGVFIAASDHQQTTGIAWGSWQNNPIGPDGCTIGVVRFGPQGTSYDAIPCPTGMTPPDPGWGRTVLP